MWLGEVCHVVSARRQAARGYGECPRCARPFARAMQEEYAHYTADEIMESFLVAMLPN